jgi:hypothetical protein
MMFGNTDGSPEYNQFLALLGEKVELLGWTRYRAGLDVKANNTGTHSVHTTFHDFQIMFHVATLLPHTAEAQQVERKRHIGNDIGVIVFKEGPEPFVADTFRSEFNHVFAVVSKSGNAYNLEVIIKDGVPAFGPKLPTPPIFEDPSVFREFLLCKREPSTKEFPPLFISLAHTSCFTHSYQRGSSRIQCTRIPAVDPANEGRVCQHSCSNIIGPIHQMKPLKKTTPIASATIGRLNIDTFDTRREESKEKKR